MTPEPCRSCKAPMIWARTERGKNIPLDAEPSPKGTIALVDSGHAGAPLLAVFSGPALHDGRPLYASHFATCPQSKRWRKRQKAAADDAMREMGIDPLAGEDVGSK